MDFLRSLKKNKELIWFLAKDDIKKRYAGSSLGVFSDGINSVTSVFLEYSYLVKKVVFDIKILPVIKIISATFVHLFFILLIFIVMALFGYMPNICYIQAFYYSFCMICLILAIGYFTSSLSVFFRDLPQLVQVILSAGM